MIRILATAIAVLFGIATLFAGGRVLLGSDPGYVVFRPLLVYNVLMGLAYVAAGIIFWRSARAGRNAAAAIFLQSSSRDTPPCTPTTAAPALRQRSAVASASALLLE